MKTFIKSLLSYLLITYIPESQKVVLLASAVAVFVGSLCADGRKMVANGNIKSVYGTDDQWRRTDSITPYALIRPTGTSRSSRDELNSVSNNESLTNID